MKILFYSPIDLLNGGGCERWHCIVTNALKAVSGADVEIITGSLQSNPRWSMDQLTTFLKGVPYLRLDYPIMFGVLIPTPSIIYTLYKKFKAVDRVHFIYGFMGQDILVAFLSLVTGTKVTVGHHAPTFHSSKIHNLYMKLVSRYVMTVFNSHQTLNTKDKKFFANTWGIKNVNYIPSGIDVKEFINLSRNTKPNTLSFLAVGRLAEQKGFDLLIEAIRDFNQVYPDNNCVFNVVGSGPMETDLKQKALTAPNVVFHGFVDEATLMKLYSEADIYLLTSREEPFGLVLIEAWAAGMPILATKTEGPVDMLKDGENGWFIENISVNAIKDGIVDLYNKYHKNKDGLANMEEVCRQTGNDYSIEASAKKMVDILFKN